MCVWVCVCVHVHVCVYMYIVGVYVYMCMCTCVCVYVYMYIHYWIDRYIEIQIFLHTTGTSNTTGAITKTANVNDTTVGGLFSGALNKCYKIMLFVTSQ